MPKRYIQHDPSAQWGGSAGEDSAVVAREGNARRQFRRRGDCNFSPPVLSPLSPFHSTPPPLDTLFPRYCFSPIHELWPTVERFSSAFYGAAVPFITAGCCRIHIPIIKATSGTSRDGTSLLFILAALLARNFHFFRTPVHFRFPLLIFDFRAGDCAWAGKRPEEELIETRPSSRVIAS